ncbi:MAG: M28 family peptidase [Nitrospinota bacterium]
MHHPILRNIPRKICYLSISFVISLCLVRSIPQAAADPGPPIAGAGGRAEGNAQSRPDFDARRALDLIRKQLSFGSRTIGRPGHEAAGRFLERELRRYADRVVLQKFRFQDFDLTNVIGWICARGMSRRAEPNAQSDPATPCPGTDPPVLLAAHWDTHPFASRDPDRSRRRLPVPGANDGGSGTAILLELARAMRERRPPRDLLIVLFDGEDYGIGEEWFIGSTHFARAWKGPRPAFGILLDMVGDRDLNIHVEGYSARKAPEVVRKIWDAAKRAGARSFRPDVKHYVLDDHIPLNDAGIPTADIIDFDYPPWHTSQDTLDKVSARSLEEVARVVIEAIYTR